MVFDLVDDPAYISIRQHTSEYVSIHQHTSANISIRQHTLVFDLVENPALFDTKLLGGGASDCIRQHTSAYVSIRQHTPAYVSIRQHTSVYVSVHQHTSVYVSIPDDTALRSIGKLSLPMKYAAYAHLCYADVC